MKRLRTSDGGGNKWGRARWYANMSAEDESNYLPGESDTLPKYKELVYVVYERKLFYNPSATLENVAPEVGNSQVPAKSIAPPASSGSTRQAPNKIRKAQKTSRPTVSKTTEEEEVDLLQFETSDSASGSISGPNLMGPASVVQMGAASTTSGFMQAPMQSGASAVGHGGVGEFDPFASLQPQKQRTAQSNTRVQKQFINAMANATGDPFAALHMNNHSGPQRVPVPAPQPAWQQAGAMQPGMQQYLSGQPRQPTMIPQQAQVPTMPAYRQPNGVHPQQGAMPFIMKPSSNDDPFAGLQ